MAQLRTSFFSRFPGGPHDGRGRDRRLRRGLVRADPPGHLPQGLELLLVEQGELGGEVVEVLVAGVDVGLGADGHQAVEVVDVHVDEDPVNKVCEMSKVLLN